MKIADSFIEAGQNLHGGERVAYYAALVEYVAYQKEPEIDGAARAVFEIARRSIDITRARSEAGRRGGLQKANNRKSNHKDKAESIVKESSDFARPFASDLLASKTLANPLAKHKTAGRRPKIFGVDKSEKTAIFKDLKVLRPTSYTVMTTYKEKEKINKKKKKPQDEIPFEAIVSYLNQATGSKFRFSSQATQRLIKARWAEGFRLEDFRKVIDGRCKKWLHDPKMSEYLRPQTVFGPKFESYLADCEREGAKSDRFAKYADV